MPRRKASAKPAEPVKPAEPEPEPEPEPEVEEHEETMEEEEVEYEEVEEEVEEIEEEEEEVVEEEEEEEDPDEEETASGPGTNGPRDSKDDDQTDEDESKKHAELLALPPHGSEVYVGNIPHDALEEDLRNFCESVGEVFEVRMMKGKDSSENKGYAFVTFRTKELAAKAIRDLRNAEFKGKKIKCSTSQAKHRLFIGNVPRNWTKDDLKKVVSEVGPGVINVDLMKVKAVYVKNLPKNVTQDQLIKLFERHGEITKVVLPPPKPGHEKRYAFVHFKERSMAMKALKNTEKYELDGDVLDCSLAKPPSDKKVETAPSAQKGPLLPNYPLPIGYGLMGGAYGALAPAPMQPMFYGRGPNPAGMAMVPMVLPDGRVGYVLQQPGAPMGPAHQGSSNRGGSSSGGRKGGGSGSGGGGGGDGNRGRRYRPY
ncbi:Heterogeneous nuclear ribonucleoprotein R [Ananas comosus]|uniref:Heterogeneous nuclear ribonucleoprotein R n=1 Tax=Ananas comosus TaxID=4615 RepID=A0A199VK21_ANACO|nr:Heterogeneous nuclear ribonucleoprotein R [Ananas comosus]